MAEARETGLSRHWPQVSERTVKLELTRLAVRRQAQIGTLELEVYAPELTQFAELDFDEGLRSFHRPRAQGETAWPALDDLLEACRDARFRRLTLERRTRERQAEEEERQHRLAHPEEYFSVAAVIREKLNGRAFGAMDASPARTA